MVPRAAKSKNEEPERKNLQREEEAREHFPHQESPRCIFGVLFVSVWKLFVWVACWTSLVDLVEEHFLVVLDGEVVNCSFDQSMDVRELTSLAKQIQLAYTQAPEFGSLGES